MPALSRLSLISISSLALGWAVSAHAEKTEPAEGHLADLKACQEIKEDQTRLSCFDQAVSSMLQASQSGDVQVLEKADVEKTRRSLFGFSLPDLGIFGGGGADKDDKKRADLLETTISSVRYGRDEIFFTTPEGGTWRISHPPRRLRKINTGDAVVFKRAAMGSFFIRINGQIGVKGRRIK